MMKYKVHFIIAAVCILIGRYVLSPKQEIVTVTKYVEVKQASSSKKEKKKTRTTIVIKPDGTSTTDTTTEETSDTSSNTSSSTSSSTSKIISKGSTISLGVLAIKDAQNIQRSADIGVIASIPLIGNVSAVGIVDTSKRVGLGLSLEF
jgi:hypothetical protein